MPADRNTFAGQRTQPRGVADIQGINLQADSHKHRACIVLSLASRQNSPRRMSNKVIVDEVKFSELKDKVVVLTGKPQR